MNQRKLGRARRIVGGSLIASLALAGGIAAVASQGSGCAQQPVTVPVRSLERSGRVSFVCLDKPGVPRVEHPLEDCSTAQSLTIGDYSVTDDAGAEVDGGPTLPHLYALVTQTQRGEVAVIDTTAQTGSVLDEDPRIPGSSFLPVGAQPIDIVSTPGGTATFVGVAEIGHAGIFALPSSQIRPAASSGIDGGVSDQPVPELSSWPACALPSAPGQMLLVDDLPTLEDGPRGSCDRAYGDYDPPGDNGDLGLEGPARQKLVVAMPDLGGIAIFDAQEILDRAPGDFGACKIERWVKLSVDVEATPPAPPPTGVACAPPPPAATPPDKPVAPWPSGIAYAAGRLYVSDYQAPVIHILDLPTPCDPVERKPLLPTSVERPERLVTTSHVAVSQQLTPAASGEPNLKRYLYAIDHVDGSLVVFDVSADATTRRPLERKHPELDPFEPRDRVRFAAAPADIVIVQRDVALGNPATGVAAEGVRCDPDPTAVLCDSTSASCDTGTLYRTTPAYDSGAGPLKLRGTFAFAALTSGKVAVIDIDDYDAPCRRPQWESKVLGCGSDQPTSQAALVSSNELSCNMFVPNTARDANYEAADPSAGFHVPGLVSYPKLFAVNAAPLDIADPVNPRMVATFAAGTAPPKIAVGGVLVVDRDACVGKPSPCETPVLQSDGSKVDDGPQHILAMNLEDPRAQIVDQEWAVTFEGSMPGFIGKIATLQAKGESTDGLYDPNSRFCDQGVLGKIAVDEILASQPELTEQERLDRADYVQITSDLPVEQDTYWGIPDLACDFQQCLQSFGSVDDTTPAVFGRDFRIVEAYQDHVELEFRNLCQSDKNECCFETSGNEPQKCVPWTTLELAKCCFGGSPAFTVRAGAQWTAVGAITGFLHHVIAGGPEGSCRNSCDPVLERKNGRIPSAPPDFATPINDGDPYAFQNPMFRLGIISGTQPTPRDAQFHFTTTGSFLPLQIVLSLDGTELIAPQAITYVPSTGELAITDGALNGLIMVNLASVSVSRSFF